MSLQAKIDHAVRKHGGQVIALPGSLAKHVARR
jgi:hypothetical protein